MFSVSKIQNQVERNYKVVKAELYRITAKDCVPTQEQF